jgi:hypothetical protein
LLISLLGIGLYAVSLSLPAFSCATGKSFMGYEVLAMGWAGLITLDPRWFANAGFWMLLYRSVATSRDIAPGAMGIAVVLGLASLLPAAGCAVPGGAPGVSSGLAAGGYLWVASLIAACAANFAVIPKMLSVPRLQEESTSG